MESSRFSKYIERIKRSFFSSLCNLSNKLSIIPVDGLWMLPALTLLQDSRSIMESSDLFFIRVVVMCGIFFLGYEFNLFLYRIFSF